jgi:predicted small secreted protein
MNWKSFMVGLSIGIVSGYAVKEIASQNIPIPPEKVLNNTKKIFSENGPISGSWIHMKVEPYERNNLSYKVYKGGISRAMNGVPEQYEFIADAITGSILEVY